jgi:hypothetical protein
MYEQTSRSDDPLPPTDTTREAEEFDAWKAQRSADQRASLGGAQEGEPGCPTCGASLDNPANVAGLDTALDYCWRCGLKPAQGYPAKAAD